MNSEGWRIGWPRHGPPSSQLRRRLRYQFSPPRKPVRENSLRVVVEVGLAQPRRQRRRIDGVAEQGAVGQRDEALALFPELAAGGVIEATQRATDVPLQLGLGHAGLLEILQVEVVDAELSPARSGCRHGPAARRARSWRRRRGTDPVAKGPHARRPARPSRGRRSPPWSRQGPSPARPCRRPDERACTDRSARAPRCRHSRACRAPRSESPPRSTP